MDMNFSSNTRLGRRDANANETLNQQQQQYKFCGEAYKNFFLNYDSIDHKVKAIFSGLGFITNLINIFVFTRKEMRNPLNTILTALALADGLFLLTVFTTFSLMWIRIASFSDVDANAAENGRTNYWKTSQRRAVEYAIYCSFYYFFHYCAIYLMVLVALWRMLGITFPLKSRTWLTEGNARRGILIAVFCALVISATWFVPVKLNYLEQPDKTGNETLRLYYPAWSSAEERLFVWTYAICAHLIPILLVTGFTGVLVRSLLGVRNGLKWSEMSNHNSLQWGILGGKDREFGLGSDSNSILDPNGNSSFNRTTKILLTLDLIFVVTEIPDSIITILYNSLPSDNFVFECLKPTVWFVMNFEQVSSLSSFFIYLGMSKRFRQILTRVFKRGKA